MTRAVRLALTIALGVIACAPPEEAQAPSIVIAPAPAVPPAATARKNLFAARTDCAGPLCPVAPAFPHVVDFSIDAQGRPCIIGSDRHGCLEPDGWHFATGAASPPATPPEIARFDYAPQECRLAEAGWVFPLGSSGVRLFWQATGQRTLVTQNGCRPLAPVPLEPVRPNVVGEGFLATDVGDVWGWSHRFITHWDGVRWERVELPAPCTRESVPLAVTSREGAIWFARCEEQTRSLVRFDPRTNQATRAGLSPVMGLALVAGKITATDFGDDRKVFRRHVFESDGRATVVDDNDRVFLRAGFDDGTTFSAGFGLFSEVQRYGGDKVAQTIALPSPAEGFYAPNPREVWVGGEHLQRWRDGMMGKITYRPDSAKSVVTAIGGSNSNDVWVVSRAVGARERAMHLSHWNGATWWQADLPEATHAIPSIAVANSNDAWLTTETRLWHWNGASWSQAGEFPKGQGLAVVLTPEAVFVLGNSTIYRRAR